MANDSPQKYSKRLIPPPSVWGLPPNSNLRYISLLLTHVSYICIYFNRGVETCKANEYLIISLSYLDLL